MIKNVSRALLSLAYATSAVVLGLSISASPAQSAECQVTLEGAYFTNHCSYTVFVTYTADCPDRSWTGLGVGPIRPGGSSMKGVGNDRCSYRWSWKEY